MVPLSERHIFISYASTNLDFVTRLKADLQAAGVVIWLDKDNLKPGTRNWEETLRAALREARMVLFVATSDARKSNFVQDELSIAEMENCPILPLWAAGEHWIESIPMGMGKMQNIDLRGDNYAANFPQVLKALEVSAPPLFVPVSPPSAPIIEPRNPYKGLNAFTTDDQRDYFGREDLIAALVERLRTFPNFIALVGASGAGKSSVIMAGLLPKLQVGTLPNSEQWRYLRPVKPGTHPLESLAISIKDALKDSSIRAILEDLEAKDTRGLHRIAALLPRSPKARVVLLIDQFEEVFTQTVSEVERDQFINLLTTAANESASPLTIIITLRADFSDRPLNYAELGHLIDTHRETLLLMTLTDLRRVIEGPAALPDVGLSFDEGLVSDLVYEVRGQAGGMPLLQFTLDQLFQRREGQRLTRQAYDALGGLRGALRTHAEDTYQALSSDEHRKLARSLFLRLIELGATEQDTTRRRAPISELTMSDSAQTDRMREVSDTFVNARLLTAETDTLEVSHEALIREWPRLGAWLRESRDDIRAGHDLSDDVAEWLRRGKPSDRLYRGVVLDEALAWSARNLTSADEMTFLQGSEAARQRDSNAESERITRELDLAKQAAESAQRAQAAEQDRAIRFRRAAGVAGIVAFIAVIGIVVAILTASNAIGQTNIANTQLRTADAQAKAAMINQGNTIATSVAIALLNDLTQNELATLVPNIYQVPPTILPALSFDQRIATATRIAVLYTLSTTTPPATFDGVEMVLVPSGCFLMGSGLYANEQPVHRQCFEQSFWIDKYEVTNAQFAKFHGQSAKQSYWTEPKRPRESITWFESRDFCVTRGAHLPTEAEWEYAARGPNSLQYPWGADFVDGKVVYNVNETAEVGSKLAGVSWIGAYDMSGNVWEWVSSIYLPYPYRADNVRENIDDKTNVHVVRGGSWNDSGAYMRAAFRNRYYSASWYNYLGFRCARSAQ